MALSPTTKQRLEMQGFTGLDEATLCSVEPAARLTPLLCSLSALITGLSASAYVAWVFAALGILGAVFPRHAFDLLYNFVLRPLFRGPALPPNGGGRRLACGMGGLMLAGAGWAFWAGATTLSYVLCGIMTVMAAIAGLTHFCLAALIYRAVFGRRGPAT